MIPAYDIIFLFFFFLFYDKPEHMTAIFLRFDFQQIVLFPFICIVLFIGFYTRISSREEQKKKKTRYCIEMNVKCVLCIRFERAQRNIDIHTRRTCRAICWFLLMFQCMLTYLLHWLTDSYFLFSVCFHSTVCCALWYTCFSLCVFTF